VVPSVRSLINPRQSSPVEYTDSPLNQSDHGGVFGGSARAGMPAPEARLQTPQGQGHMTELFGSAFVALYFSNQPSLPASLQRVADAAPSGAGSLRLIRVAAGGATDARTVVDELGQAWQRYDARESTLYLIRPDGYVMGRWRDAESSEIDMALKRALEEQVHEQRRD
jgi:3-(3-hydroxy-phenyl)propionate hydroxylase